MRRLYQFFTLPLFLFSFLVMAQSASASDSVTTLEEDSLFISHIIFVGNVKTKEHVLLREMKSRVGSQYLPDQVQEDGKRLQNLKLFTRVEMKPMLTEEGDVALIVIVAERWYVFPYPILFISERDWKKLSYGAGLVYENVRGMNTDLSISGWLGYNPGVNFYYYNPWFGGEKHLFTKLLIFSNRIRSKSPFYPRFHEKHQGFLWTLGKRWGYHTFFSVEMGFDRLSLPEEYHHLTLTKSGTDQLPSVGASFRYDTRDLYEYPRSGWRVNGYAQKTYYPDQIDYFRYGADIRRYISLYRDFSLALRSMIDASPNHLPTYARRYLGFEERIRGHYSDRREGDNRWIAGAELRFPIIGVRYFNLGDTDSPMGSYAMNLPFGVSGALFYDAGNVWSHSQTPFDRPLSGFGVGLHVHLPYIELFRVDYAFNQDGKSQIILDIGVMF